MTESCLTNILIMFFYSAENTDPAVEDEAAEEESALGAGRMLT